MSKDGKFGTFGGVFTPSILTILGVIMYLRLPWVVGNSGLWTALGIILVAHVISVTTGLSISSIATDKNVGAGGPYYIVSRSLGLPIGGTLGLALFVGLSFSISLYVIGFCESMLSFSGLEVSPTNLRIAGTITIIAVTVVTFVSTAFAIKTQYFILGAIVLSLGSILLGGLSDATPPSPAAPITEPPAGAPSLGVLFGIFFPAVTGFTAGVNMSGDLKDPKRSIPTGTMAAISVGLVVYVGLAVFVAFRVDPAALREDTDVLTKVALVPALVTAGIWGATLSSALGSILGAPRILQALSVDRITPRFFAKGTGKTNEPRNALLLAFAIGEGGILIAELDVIARVVSMVFLTTYGFLNISSAIESWASPDFRPSFRIPRLVSVIGAITSAIVMIQLDFAAMAGATVLMAALFLLLKRRQLTLDAGDTWEGIWSSIVRAGLHRLNQSGRGQRRNWRPNVLAFSYEGDRSRAPLLELSRALITGNGLLTDFELVDPGRKATAEADDDDDEATPVGVFRRRVPCRDFYETVGSVCRHHGFTGLDPNTVLLDWEVDRKQPERFLALVRETTQQDFNLLLLRHDPQRGWGKRRRIDVWWRPQQGNVELSLSLMRFLTRFEPWQEAQLRFLLVSEDSAFSEDLLHAMRGVLAQARVDAKVRVVASPSQAHGFESTVRQESSDADLVVLGLPAAGKLDAKRLEALDELLQGLGTTLLLQGSSMFEEVLPVGGRTGLAEAIERAQASATELRPLHLPKLAELEEPAAAFAAGLGTLSDELFRRGLAPVLARQEALLTDVKQLVVRQFEIVRKGVGEADPARARKPAGRAQGGFLFQARKLVSSFEEEELPAQAKALQARLEAFCDGLRALGRAAPKTVAVRVTPDELRPKPEDDRYLRRFKRRRRWAARLWRSTTYEAPVGALQAWYVDEAGAELLEQTLRSAESSSHRLAVQLGKILNEAATELSAVLSAIDRRDIDSDGVEERKRRVVSHVDAAIALARDLTEGTAARLAERAHELGQLLAREIERLDIGHLVRGERKPPKPKRAAARFAALLGSPETWQHHQGLLLHRAQLGLQVAAFQHRFSVLALRARNDVAHEIRGSVLGEGATLLEAVRSFAAEAEQGTPKAPAERDLRARFDGHAVLESIAQDVDEQVKELPETITTLSDEAIAALESGVATEAEEISVSVRPLVKYLIETEFFDVVNQEISGIPMQEQRTVGVARDVMRLLSFTMADLDAAGGWDNAALRKQVVGVAKEGAQRLGAELDVLRTTVDAFVTKVGQQLEHLREETAPYSLTSRSDSLSHYIRSRGSQRAVSRLRELGRRLSERTRDVFVALLYRSSAGVLLARRLRRTAEGEGVTVVDQITATTHALTPRRELLRALPFYYRQLFSGQASVSETFWVGRKAELERARAAVRRYEQGGTGALFVVGEIGSGKTALCQAIVAKLLSRRPVVRITPPPGGAIEPNALRLAFEGELDERGELDALEAKIPDGAVVVLDDLELWWERSEAGMVIIDRFLAMLARHGRRCLFVANLNVHAWRVLGRVARLEEHALAVIECEPLPAEALKSIISLRHGSTGVKLEVDGTPEDELAPWRQARLFTRYFDFSGGLVAVALRAWLANIEKVDGTTLQMRWPRRPRTEALARLRVELRVLLVQLVVHKQVTVKRLQRLSGLPEAELEADLGALTRMSLVRRDERDVLHVDRFVAHLVTDRLRAQGMLA
ncbi:MAG: amino acid permease [Myxococcales bacterium]|nr:amino acid permease [Myxococcales bacterium]